MSPPFASFRLAMPVSEFRHRWLAESLHRLGVPPRWRRGAVGGAAAPEADEQAVLRWSALQPECQSLAVRMDAWARHAGWLVAGALLLALLTGAAGAWGVLGDGSRPVNVLWTVLLLLGMPTLGLILMLVLATSPASRGLSFGELGWQLSRRLARCDEGAAVVEALARLLASGACMRPLLQSISHAVWFAAVLGAVLGLLSAFSLRSYQFVWQTTVLPDAVFVALIQILGAPGRWFGFAQPDATAIAASVGEGLADPAIRRAWAAWVIGVCCAIGLLPRLVLGAASVWMLRRRMRRARLALQQPFFQQLLAQRAAMSSRLGAAAEPVPVPEFRLARNTGVTAGMRLVALEVGAIDVDEGGWSGHAVHRVDERDEREAELTALATHPVRRLLILLDARHSPDRSVATWMAKASAHASDSAVCLLHTAGAGSERQAAWHAFLAELGLDADRRFDQCDTARCWLEGEVR